MAGVRAMPMSQKPTTAEELLAMLEAYERLKSSKHRYNLADCEVIVCACKTFLKAMEEPRIRILSLLTVPTSSP
jgi:hypothetical protein